MTYIENIGDFANLNTENYKTAKCDKMKEENLNFKNLKDESFEKATKEYAAMIYGILYNFVFTTVKTSEIMSGGIGEEVFRSFLVDEYAKNIAETSNTGVESLLYNFYNKTKKEKK